MIFLFENLLLLVIETRKKIEIQIIILNNKVFVIIGFNHVAS